jgi:hypothetical protein
VLCLHHILFVGHYLLTTVQANLNLILVVALQNSTERAFKEREEDSVDGWAVILIASSAIFALYEHELGFQRNISPRCPHSLSHPPQLEPETTHESKTPVTK